MKSPLKVALLAALPVEVVNFCLLSWRFPAPLPPHWIHKVVAIQWLILHWLGILALNALYRMGSSAVWEILAFVICGYVETAALLAVLLFALRGLRHWRARHHAIHS